MSIVASPVRSPPDLRAPAEDPGGTGAAGRHAAASPPNGAAAATLLAGGIGCAWFGLLVLLNDASPSLHDRLTLSRAVGPLSGKAIVGVSGWLVAWFGLDRRYGNRHVRMAPVVRATRILVVAAFVLTFPPFYMLFAAG